MIGRTALAVVLAGAVLFGGSDPALAWGSRIHEIVNRRAAEALPEPARTAWAPLARSLGMHAADADFRKGSSVNEPARHYIDIDFYDDPPFDGVSRDLKAMRRRFGGETVDKWGVAPWAIEECWRMVVLSLEQGDWGSAGAWAADLGHYVADTHQPLHCTMNYDGQRTDNRGIHIRFEIHMMNRHFQEDTLPPAGPWPDRGHEPLEFSFEWIAEAYEGLGALLEGDDAARAADENLGDRYYEVLWDHTQDVATLQVGRAVEDLAALWLSAWEEAGRPEGPGEAPPFRALPRELLDQGEAGGRVASRTALAVAGGILLGAFVLGSS